MENLWNRLLTLVNQNQLLDLLGKTILSLLILALFVILGRILRNTVKRVVNRTSRNANLPILLSNLVYVALIIIALLAILSIYTGAGLSTLLTLFGLVSLAVSLSIQDILKNFVSGVYLLLEQPFSIGDRVKVRDVEGQVENIEIRTTQLHTDDGVQVFIPNSIVFAEIVTNRTAYRHRLTVVRFTMPLDGKTFEEFSGQVKAVVAEFDNVKVSKDPAPQVFVETIAAKLYNCKLDFWSPVTAPSTTASDVVLALVKSLPELEVTGVVAAAAAPATAK
ncbi:MAG: mechanosensitive ion channel family protein [Chloroflexi bacterium]|nr:mechanosensitive ion channel family protein [Chloroflexota bacterium]